MQSSEKAGFLCGDIEENPGTFVRGKGNSKHNLLKDLKNNLLVLKNTWKILIFFPKGVTIGFGTLKCTASGMTQYANINYYLTGDLIDWVNATVTYWFDDPEIGIAVQAGEDKLNYPVNPPTSKIYNQTQETQVEAGYYSASIAGSVTGLEGTYGLASIGDSNKVYLHF